MMSIMTKRLKKSSRSDASSPPRYCATYMHGGLIAKGIHGHADIGRLIAHQAEEHHVIPTSWNLSDGRKVVVVLFVLFLHPYIHTYDTFFFTK